MWNLFNQRKALDKEVFETLRPGDLYGGEHRAGKQPEDLVRYLLLACVPGVTFFSIVLFRVDPANSGHEDIVSAVWLLALGAAIACGAWALFRLSRAGEGRALLQDGADNEPADLPPTIRALMKRAATMKLLAFRVMIVSGISFCVGLYLGLKGLILL